MGTGGARRRPCWTSAGWPARSGVVVRPLCSTSVTHCGTAVAASRKILSADLYLNLQRMLGQPCLYPSGLICRLAPVRTKDARLPRLYPSGLICRPVPEPTKDARLALPVSIRGVSGIWGNEHRWGDVVQVMNPFPETHGLSWNSRADVCTAGVSSQTRTDGG